MHVYLCHEERVEFRDPRISGCGAMLGRDIKGVSVLVNEIREINDFIESNEIKYRRKIKGIKSVWELSALLLCAVAICT